MTKMSSDQMLLLVLSCFTLVKTETDLPSYFPRCYRDDPDLGKCLLKATDQVRPYLQKGIPDLEIAQIAPYKVFELKSSEDSHLANYTAVLSNVIYRGLDGYKFSSLEFDPKTLIFIGSLEIPLLDLRGNYSVHGKLLGVPLDGNGGFNINITNCKVDMKQDCKLVSKKGAMHLQPTKTDCKFVIDDFTYTYNGMYDDLPRLAKIANSAIKEYKNELLDRLRPAIEASVARISEEVLFKKLYKVPYDKLFPEHK